MNIEELIENFEFLGDWEERYRYIIELGRKLPEFDPSNRTEEYKVRGCQSQVWLTYESTDEQLKFNMDSDAHIVRGLIAVVLIAIQNRSAADIQQLDIEEIFSQLDLLAHLSVTRGNGLRAMVSRVKEVARGYAT